MLAIERQNRILTNLQVNQTALVSDLSKEYRVTEETIRRDLEKLEKRGLIKKTYGGAIFGQDVQMDYPFRIKQQKSGDIEIAKTAADLIQDGETIMLDASIDAVHLACALRQKKDLRVITNSVEILTVFGYIKNLKIISTGGILLDSSAALAGPAAEQCIRCFHVDKAFLSCAGLDQDSGATESDEQEAEVKTAMAAAARQVILMADTDKFNRTSFIRFLGFDQIHTIITNHNPGEIWLRFFKEKQIECIA